MATKKKRKGSAKPKRGLGKKSVTARRPTTTAAAPTRTAKQDGASSRKKTKGPATKGKPVRKNIPRERAGSDRKVLSRSGTMSGDLQGLSDSERANSESVSDLVEEGNAFEAGVVKGVEEAEDNPEQEVRPRQVPEDDVPQEYLDED